MKNKKTTSKFEKVFKSLKKTLPKNTKEEIFYKDCIEVALKLMKLIGNEDFYDLQIAGGIALFIKFFCDKHSNLDLFHNFLEIFYSIENKVVKND